MPRYTVTRSYLVNVDYEDLLAEDEEAAKEYAEALAADDQFHTLSGRVVHSECREVHVQED